MNGTDAWLLLAVKGQRQYGGNAGYVDEPSSYYSWDSSVPNHASIEPGNRIAIWDKTGLLGCSIIQSIEIGSAEKTVFRCPNCRYSNIKQRIILEPLYRCHDCKAVFNRPHCEQISVTTYRSRHDIAWTDYDWVLGARALRGLALRPSSQHSLRALNWDRFLEVLHQTGAPAPLSEQVWSALGAVIARRNDSSDGRSSVLRVRSGPALFRRELLAAYGNNCAMSGPAPQETLEAAHLYSYTTVATQHDHGGMLLRRDLCPLLDSGRIAVDGDQRIDLHPALLKYNQYFPLHGSALLFEPNPMQQRWIAGHYRQHRSAPSTH